MDPARFKVNQQPRQDGKSVDTLSSLPPPPPPSYSAKTKPKQSKWWVWLVLVVIIIAGVLGAWAYKLHKTKPPAPSSTTKHLSSSTTKPVTQPPAPSIPMSSHTSASFGLTFNYPSAWSVVDSGNAGLTVTSPVMSLTAANNQVVDGQIVMSVAKQGAIPTAITSDAVAVMTSQTVNYSSPTANQAADTYISFVQYPTTTTKGGLDGIYVSGNYGYQKDQTVPSSDLAKVDPLIYFTFYTCASTSCPASTRQPLTIAAASSWSNSSISAPILLILKSFSFD